MSTTKATDIVYLHGLRCECIIGIWAWERSVKQTLILDIDLASDVAKAAENDELSDAIDYQAVAHRVQEFAAESEFELIETLIDRIAALILSEFDTSWVRIKLDKGAAVKGVKHVGLLIERSKH